MGLMYSEPNNMSGGNQWNDKQWEVDNGDGTNALHDKLSILNFNPFEIVIGNFKWVKITYTCLNWG